MSGTMSKRKVRSGYARSVFLRYVEDHPASAQYSSFPLFIREELGISDGHVYLHRMLRQGLLERTKEGAALTEEGRKAIDRDDIRFFDLANPYVTIYEFRAELEKQGDGATFESAMLAVLTRKIPLMKSRDEYLAVENISLDAAVLFENSGQPRQAMHYYLMALYYETCGLEYYEKLVRLVHSKCKKDSVKNDYRGVCVHPEVVDGMHRMRDAFDEKMVEELFQSERIAINMLSRKDFMTLAKSLCEGTYDYNKWNAKYGKNFTHVLEQAEKYKGEKRP